VCVHVCACVCMCVHVCMHVAPEEEEPQLSSAHPLRPMWSPSAGIQEGGTVLGCLAGDAGRALCKLGYHTS
jgi:hypothetical protein